MNQKLKPASRLSVVFILVVILSGSILTWFSINNISNQKVLTEKRILEEQRELSLRFSEVLQKQIENVTTGFINETNPTDLLKDSLFEKAAEHDFFIQPFILKDNVDFLFPNFIGISGNIIKPKFSYRFKSAFSEGEKAEFTKNNFTAARDKYLFCQRVSTGAQDSAKALNALGRISVKLNDFENAIQHYNTIVLNYFSVTDENGIPYIYYALPQLIKITEDGFEKQLQIYEFCLKQMENGIVPMNFNTEEIVTQIVESMQEMTLNNPEKKAQIIQLGNTIRNQLDFINDFKDELPKLIANEGNNNRLHTINGFKIIDLVAENDEECFFINTEFTTPAGFLINRKKLLETALHSDMQHGFEFDYDIEFPAGYNSNTKGQNLIFSSQLNPFFPEQTMQIKLSDENLIKDLIQRRSWIYGISTVLLLVAMVLGVVLIVRDIAREKRLAQLQSDFISNVTHELKTPLTSISMFTESILLKRVKKESDKNEYLSIILKESDRLKRMINNILEFSKLEKGKSDYRFINTNLASLIKAAIGELDYWFEKEGFEVVAELDNQVVSQS